MTEKFYDHALIAVDDLIPYAMNSRTHSDAQVAQIAASIREFGFTNPVLIDEANNLIAGHGRVLAARKLKMDVVPAIVVTGLDENRRRALIIADNQLALNAEWDQEKLVAELQSMSVDMQKLVGFNEEELIALLKNDSESENQYTKKTEIPVYEPTGPKPDISTMFDSQKTFDLLNQIKVSNLPDDEKKFLELAAGRHTVFNFEIIANYYAHASKECQELMENSALVIIDFEKAIENGYVKLSEKISEQYLMEYQND